MASAEDLAEKRTEFLNKAAVKTAIAADADLQKQVDQLVALAGMTPDPSVDPLLLLGVDPQSPAEGTAHSASWHIVRS